MKRITLFQLKKSWGRYLLTTLCALLLGAGWAHAQVSVKGTITSSTDNAPLPGVNIVVKGTTTGTITDIEGNFSLTVPDKSSVLVISSMGFLSEEITIGDQTNITFALAEDITGLDEVVVIGYGAIRKKEVTGAVARVSAEEITSSVTSNLGSALQGHVAGVQVTASGRPGDGADVLIRGISSISGNSPLYVIDGVPFDYDPGISPSEIESIDILKDAASCAIYGTRGAAGVILVTTKQGKAGALKVNVNGSYGISSVTSHTPLMNAQEDTYFNMVRYRNTNGLLDDEQNLEVQKYPTGFHYDTDIRETVFIDNAATQDYNMNVSGGRDNITYNVMAGYYDQKGVIINSYYQRFNTRANTTYQKGRLKVDASIGMTHDDKDEENGGIINQTLRYLPTQQDFADVDPDETLVSTGGDNANRMNWVINSIRSTNNITSSTAFGNFNASFEIIEGLTASTRYSINHKYAYRKKFAPYQEVIGLFDENLSAETDSYVENVASRRNNMMVESLLRYKKSFGDHTITAQAGFTAEEMDYESFYARAEGVIDNRIEVLNGVTLNREARSTNEWDGDFDWEHRRIGTLGRVLYSFKDGLYNLNVSGRYDGSAKFSPDYRWGFFPSVSASWNISDEAFWSALSPYAQDVKLRISRGTTGNENFDSYTYSPLVYTGNDYAFGPDASDVLRIGMIQRDFANPYVKWETSIQWNAGIDMAFLDNRMTFTAEVYDTKKEDMLFPVIVPGSASGAANVTTYQNVGNMTNKGYEIALGYRAYDREFKWSVTGTYAANKNEITSMVTDGEFMLMSGNALVDGAASSSSVTALALGREVGAYYGFKTNGIIDSHEKLAAYQLINPSARMGDLIYVDTDGDGEITDSDRQYLGSGLPDFTAGLNMNAEYKGFDLYLQWYTAIGHEIMNGSKATAYGYARHKDLIYQWSPTNPVTPIPAYRGDTKSHENYSGDTDLWLEDGSYLRLKNVTLGYTLPKSILDKIKVERLRVYLSAQNPITITKYEGYDPEIGGNVANRGLDKGNYPITSFYLVGLNLNF